MQHNNIRQSKPRTRVNWFRVMVDLDRCGISARALEKILDRSQSTVSRWANGSEPKHYDGEDLIDLWAQHTGKTKSEVPKIYLYAAI